MESFGSFTDRKVWVHYLSVICIAALFGERVVRYVGFIDKKVWVPYLSVIFQYGGCWFWREGGRICMRMGSQMVCIYTHAFGMTSSACVLSAHTGRPYSAPKS